MKHFNKQISKTGTYFYTFDKVTDSFILSLSSKKIETAFCQKRHNVIKKRIIIYRLDLARSASTQTFCARGGYRRGSTIAYS